MLKVKGKKERWKKTWKKQVEEERIKVVLSVENVLCQSKWIFGINQIATWLR